MFLRSKNIVLAARCYGFDSLFLYFGRAQGAARDGAAAFIAARVRESEQSDDGGRGAAAAGLGSVGAFFSFTSNASARAAKKHMRICTHDGATHSAA